MQALHLTCDGSPITIFVANITSIVKTFSGAAIIYVVGGAAWHVEETYKDIMERL